MLVGSGGPNPWIRAGSFARLIATNTTGGMHLTDKGRFSRKGEKALLIGKSERSGAIWFSEKAVRFTRPKKKKMTWANMLGPYGDKL
jgi:hypothetical protein